jgi:hypothetical protein
MLTAETGDDCPGQVGEPSQQFGRQQTAGLDHNQCCAVGNKDRAPVADDGHQLGRFGVSGRGYLGCDEPM